MRRLSHPPTPPPVPIAVTYRGWAVRVFRGILKVDGTAADGHVDAVRGELTIRDPGTPEGLAINAMRLWESVQQKGATP